MFFLLFLTNILGKRMPHDDPTFLGFMAAIRHNMETGGKMGIVGFIPWLKDLLPRSWLGIDAMEASVANVYSYFEVVFKNNYCKNWISYHLICSGH